jgi:hypothetical protein
VTVPSVVVKIGPQAGRRVEVQDRVVIGRQSADLVLEDPEVSRSHAVLRRSGESIVLEDLGSTNGTFLNGERIREPVELRPGDEVRVGQTTFEMESNGRADDTVLSLPLRPDQIRSPHAAPSRPAISEREEEISTQPLPYRTPEGESRSMRSGKGWVAIVAVVLAAIVGLLAYGSFADRSAESDFAERANDACAAVGSNAAVNLDRTPTRGELERALGVRLQALGGLQALGEPKEGAGLVAGFLSAFADTNASMTQLGNAITGGERVAPALRGLRADVRTERELAQKAGLAGCGGLSIR